MRTTFRICAALPFLVGVAISAQEPLRPAGADVVVIVPDSLPDVPRTLTELLAARAPGVTVQRASGSIGGGAWVSLRDGAVVRGADPIVVVDGVRRARHVLADAAFDNGSGFAFPDFERRAPSPLDEIPVEDVERVEILRGPAAASAYGPDARNGVILVKTRSPGRAPEVAVSLDGGYAGSSLEFPRATVRDVGRIDLVERRIAWGGPAGPQAACRSLPFGAGTGVASRMHPARRRGRPVEAVRR